MYLTTAQVEYLVTEKLERNLGDFETLSFSPLEPEITGFDFVDGTVELFEYEIRAALEKAYAKAIQRAAALSSDLIPVEDTRRLYELSELVNPASDYA